MTIGTEAFRGALDAITRVRGVRGALVVTRDDGLIVADTLMEDVRGNAVAALTASLFSRVGLATGEAGAGRAQFVHLQAEGGLVLALAVNEELLVVALAEAGANVGLIRLEMLRAGEVVR